MEKIQKCFFHVDLDAFFASVEQLVHPEYRGKPVIISGDPHQRRNVVSTASYEARKYGVHSAMSAARAFELCPHGIFVNPDMKLYCEYSDKVMSVLDDFSPDVVQISIDEACLDMTGTEKLFGKPQDAAKKIKDRVKEYTGLTVSIGIASNPYLAKICSDINKPDGLFMVLPGDEEKFMETLPLNKVWGIGKKTLERLNSCGLKTVKDIKSHSETFLEHIFGTAGATFIYNSVRGIQPENFWSEPKTHSVSSEMTFEYDISDRYTIETYLLQLSSDVMERLLLENQTSYTVQIKIRYDDFTTVNAQQTYQTPLLCTDDLYSRIISLFDKKYEFGHEIRLLGVCTHNVINTNQIIQNELFESENKRRQTVEKAILDLETKKPEIKIHKARLLLKKTLAVFLSLFALNTFSKNAHAQETSKPEIKTVRPDTQTVTPAGAATLNSSNILPPEKRNKGFSLFNYTKDDTNIELNAEGFWNFNLTGTVNATFGYGNDFTVSTSTPVFEQEVDLSIWFLLNNHWYIQGAFADKFDKNTYAVGYYSDGILKSARISNRNIVFPETYSLTDIGRSIGGGDNEAPGISLNLSGDRWAFDSVVRYDMLSMQEKTYYGKNAVTDLKIPLNNYLTGSTYVLPDSESISKIINIYVESSQGSYVDEAGKKYKKLSSNEYLLLTQQNQIILSKEAHAQKINGVLPRILVEFNSDASSVIQTKLGFFGTPDSPGNKFLGNIQKFFGSDLNKNKPDSKKGVPAVAAFSYGKKSGHLSIPDRSGSSTDGFFVSINSKEMLLIQNSIGFSPFACCSRYDGGTAAVSDVQVASSYSENKNQNFSAVIADTVDLVQKDFFTSKRVYIDTLIKDLKISYSDPSPDKITHSSPEVNFPFAASNPGIYLGYESANDDCVMVRTFTPSQRIDIGTKAVSGTVRVYKNGILDNSAKYNPSSGEVSLSSGISDTDKIYITWYEDSSDFETGMISAATGFRFDFLDSLRGDAAFAARWAINPEVKYAEDNRALNGYFTLSSKIEWEEEKLYLSNAVGATFEVENTTGIYKIAGMDDSKPSTSYLISNAARNLPDDFCPFLNPRPDENLNTILLEKQYDCSTASSSGSMDPEISGYSVPVSYSFSDQASNPSGSDVLWASQTIIQSANKSSLPNASEYSVAVKLSDEFISLTQDASVNTKIYLQLGVSSKTDFSSENKGNIPTWKIFDSSPSAAYYDVPSNIKTVSGWQTVTVTIRDIDRAFLTEECNARFIITADRKPSSNQSGTIFIGPYETVTQGIYYTADNQISINTFQYKRKSSDVADYNTDTNYAQSIDWNVNSTSGLRDSKITVYKYFEEADISSYKTINLYFSYNVSESGTNPGALLEDDYPLHIVLDRNSKDAQTTGEYALDLKIHKKDLKKFITHDSSYKDKMHKLKINRFTREVRIDGNLLTDSIIEINPNVIPVRLKIDFDTVVEAEDSSSQLLYSKGNFFLDEFFLSENSPKVILQDHIKTTLHQEGEILKIKDFVLIKDASISATGDLISTIYTDSDFTDKTGFSGNADAYVTLATLKFRNSIGRSADSKHSITSAGHSISTTQPLLKILSLSEDFNENKDEKNVTKINSANLNFNSLKVPLSISGMTKITYDPWSLTQEVNNGLNFNIGNSYKYRFNATAKALQKVTTYSSEDQKINTDDYFTSYSDAYREQFSFGDSNAAKRITSLNVNNSLACPFASFTPEINFYQNGTYTSTSQNLFSDTTQLSFIFPFKIGNQNFSASYTRSSSLVENISKGGDYSRDIYTMADCMSEKKWFFTSLPFYDLFSNKLADDVLNTMPYESAQSEHDSELIAQSISYNADYSLSWRRPISANKYDLFVPVIATLSFARDITTAENIADTYQIKSTVGYTAVNIFSKNGSYPLLKWCTSDEYNFSFNSAHKFAKNGGEEVYQQYSTYIQANFYKNDADVIRSALQFTFQDADNWNTKATVQYTRQSSFSPLLALAKVFYDKFDYSSLNITRTDSLNFLALSNLADSTSAKLRQHQTFDYSHMIEIQITKQMSVNSTIQAGFTHRRDEICTLNFSAGIGGKLNF